MNSPDVRDLGLWGAWQCQQGHISGTSVRLQLFRAVRKLVLRASHYSHVLIAASGKVELYFLKDVHKATPQHRPKFNFQHLNLIL